MFFAIALSVAFAQDAEPAAAPVPGVALARAGLVTTWAAAPVSVGAQVAVQRGLDGDFASGLYGSWVGAGALVPSLTGPVLTSVGQGRALAALDARGVHVPRVAKRVGDGMFIGGAATAVASGAALILDQTGEYEDVSRVGLALGVASLVGSVIPFEVQQHAIVSAGRRDREVSVAVTPAGLRGRF